MKKSNDLAEELLMKNKSLDELIKLKMQEELKNAFNKRNNIKNKHKISDIKEVPKGKIFTKQAVFRVFNRNIQIETLINGLQAEALIGIQNDVREKILNGETDIFSTETLFVKFDYMEV